MEPEATVTSEDEVLVCTADDSPSIDGTVDEAPSSDGIADETPSTDEAP